MEKKRGEALKAPLGKVRPEVGEGESRASAGLAGAQGSGLAGSQGSGSKGAQGSGSEGMRGLGSESARNTGLASDVNDANVASEASDTSDASDAAKRVMGARAWAALACAVALAILWFQVFDLYAFLCILLSIFGIGSNPLPGVGTTVVVYAFFACVLVFAHKARKGRALDRSSVALLGCVALFSLVPALFADASLRIANCVVLSVVCMLAFFKVSGFGEPLWCRARVLFSSLSFGMRSLFRHWTLPFVGLAKLRHAGLKAPTSVLLGLVIAACLLLMVVPLLVSADAVFSSVLEGAFRALVPTSLDGFDALWKVLRVVLAAPVFFSLIYAAMRQEAAVANTSARPAKRLRLSAATFATVLVAVDAVYLLFIGVQFAYLFGGAQAVALHGGYAAYARSGFFQLVAVAAINVAVVLACARLVRRDSRVWKPCVALSLLLVACTGVILVSAAWRMHGYVSVYGMSFLRALTYVGMVFILIALVAAALSVMRENTRFFRTVFTSGLVLWALFCFSGVDARIAAYNVEGYLGGTIEQIDVGYLGSLSPDVLPALEELAREDQQYADHVAALRESYQAKASRMRWSEWSASYVVGL